MSILIEADELRALVQQDAPVRVLDVRWSLAQPDGRPAYLAGHIPGAVYVDLEADLAGHGAPSDGRHPLPAVDDLQAAARRWGIDDGDTVVVYDDLGNLSSARAWWLLGHAGVSDVRMLDGALRAWTDAGLPLEHGERTITRGTVHLSYGSRATLAIDEAAELARTGVLLDARAPERFRGDVEPVDPRAGHIPGAVNAPAAVTLDATGRFLPREQLRATFEALGVRPDAPTGVYCGSGVMAAADIAALALAGFDAALYPGSWSAWSNTPGRPVATGLAAPAATAPAVARATTAAQTPGATNRRAATDE
ncbi:sulfurtransferase [Subtercola sp. YIM 133946]|uniref:sulfurtransferase n=1 Tax=Subtercola sp. YIM 133946 TaxID=3118909 RepID=UPI002F954445